MVLPGSVPDTCDISIMRTSNAQETQDLLCSACVAPPSDKWTKISNPGVHYLPSPHFDRVWQHNQEWHQDASFEPFNEDLTSMKETDVRDFL